MTRVSQCLAFLAISTAVLSSGLTAAPTVFINDIHYDNAGTDTGEFIEIAGPVGTELSGSRRSHSAAGDRGRQSPAVVHRR